MSLLFPVWIILLQRVGLIGAGLYAIGLSTLVIGILGMLWRKQMQLPANFQPVSA